MRGSRLLGALSLLLALLSAVITFAFARPLSPLPFVGFLLAASAIIRHSGPGRPSVGLAAAGINLVALLARAR
jgi:hypothetical protein